MRWRERREKAHEKKGRRQRYKVKGDGGRRDREKGKGGICSYNLKISGILGLQYSRIHELKHFHQNSILRLQPCKHYDPQHKTPSRISATSEEKNTPIALLEEHEDSHWFHIVYDVLNEPRTQ